MDKDEINEKISNPNENISPLKGFGIIAEALVNKVYDIYGRNTLLSMLYQTGGSTGDIIAQKIKDKYGRDTFEISEAVKFLLIELKEFYSVKIKEIDIKSDQIKMIVENYCFLREPIKQRKRLKFGKAFCRINKGYFETALKKLIGDDVKRIEINYLENDEEKDVCIEELIFHL